MKVTIRQRSEWCCDECGAILVILFHNAWYSIYTCPTPNCPNKDRSIKLEHLKMEVEEIK